MCWNHAKCLNPCITVNAHSRVPSCVYSQRWACLNFEVWSHVPPHLKTKRRVYLLQAEAAVTARIKYHLKRSSVSHNRVKKWKREKKGRLFVQIEPLASLAAQPLCFRENGSLAFDNKKNHRGGEKKIQFSSGDAVFHSSYMKGITKGCKIWVVGCFCVCA